MREILSIVLFLNPITIDGDTFKWGTERVRLWGVDAPEISTQDGVVAATELHYLIEGQTLTCEVKGTDQYGRTVAQCWNESGKDIACLMVGKGLAEDWPYFSRGFYKPCKQED